MGIERLKEAEKDSSEAIAAVTAFLNAYLLATGDVRLSYSLEKLTKRIKDLRSLLKDFLKASDAQSHEYANKIAEIVRPKVLERV